MGYLHPAHHYPERTTKIDKMFGERLDLKGINFSVEIRVDYNKENIHFKDQKKLTKKTFLR